MLGRGLGAYVALLLAGARPTRVRGAVLADGPGLAGGGPAPGSPAVTEAAAQRTGPPDPFALMRAHPRRAAPDYASTYVRQALQFSGLDVPIVVSAMVRPPWLAAVADESGVLSQPVTKALHLFAG